MTERHPASLLEAFVLRDHPACPGCGHRIEALEAGDRCPRCRLTLTLGVSGRGRSRPAWVAGVVAASLGAGFFLLTIPITMRSFNVPAAATAAWWTGLGFGLVLPVVWIAGRRRILRLPERLVWTAAAATAAVMLGCVVALAIFE